MKKDIISGIYKIINKINKKYYVGSSIDIEKRWYNHIRMLRNGNHYNTHLQSSWDKYGEENFEFSIIESLKDIECDSLMDIEQKYLDVAKFNIEKCYNKSFVAGRVDMTIETRDKIAIKTKERHRTHAHPRLGAKLTKETKLKISIGNKGKMVSQESRKRMGDCRRGKNGILSDKNIYIFYNTITQETYSGTTFDFLEDQNLEGKMKSLSRLVNGGLKSWFGWIIDYNPRLIGKKNISLPLSS